MGKSGNKKVHTVAPGDVFGLLTVQREVRIDYLGSGQSVRGVLVRCVCGLEKAIQLIPLATGKIQSCGCRGRDDAELQLRRQIRALCKEAGYKIDFFRLTRRDAAGIR